MTIPAVRSLDGCSSSAISLGGTNFDASQQRLEILAVFRLSRDGECAQRAAVKRIIQRNNLDIFRG